MTADDYGLPQVSRAVLFEGDAAQTAGVLEMRGALDSTPARGPASADDNDTASRSPARKTTKYDQQDERG